MKVIKMIVKNYRQFDKAELLFNNDVTILAGANNSGKTSLINLIRNMISSDTSSYKESDIPATNMKTWLEQVYPLFEFFFTKETKATDIQSELLEKILPEKSEKTGMQAPLKVIKTTEVDMQIDYDPECDDIKLFADYVMDFVVTP